MHLAYLEDDKIDQMSFKRLVKGNDRISSCTVLSDVDAFKDHVKNNPVDLVVSDIILGNTNVLQEILDLGSYRLVSISGGMKPDQKIYNDNRFLGHIAKPIQKNDIHKIISVHQLIACTDLETCVSHPNINYIQSISNGDQEFEKGMLEILIKELPEEKKQLDFFAEHMDHDPKQLCNILHKIKSKLNLVGMTELFYAVDQIENNLRYETASASGKRIIEILVNRIPVIIAYAQNRIDSYENN